MVTIFLGLRDFRSDYEVVSSFAGYNINVDVLRGVCDIGN